MGNTEMYTELEQTIVINMSGAAARLCREILLSIMAANALALLSQVV